LSYNKKCNNENHNIIDIIAKLRIVFPNGKIDFYYVPAAYCKDCNKYFMLKKDFDDVKKHGTILCEIIGTEKSLLHISSKNINLLLNQEFTNWDIMFKKVLD
jgi:hypothetical protein